MRKPEHQRALLRVSRNETRFGLEAFEQEQDLRPARPGRFVFIHGAWRTVFTRPLHQGFIGRRVTGHIERGGTRNILGLEHAFDRFAPRARRIGHKRQAQTRCLLRFFRTHKLHTILLRLHSDDAAFYRNGASRATRGGLISISPTVSFEPMPTPAITRNPLSWFLLLGLVLSGFLFWLIYYKPAATAEGEWVTYLPAANGLLQRSVCPAV